MALPSMPHYWTTRRNIYEQAIVRHRNHHNDFRQKWGNTADYFQKSNVAASQQQVWESDESYRSSLNAYSQDKKKEEKAKNLARRRNKLADMLREERRGYEAELKGYSRGNYNRLEDMKDRADSLRSAREEKRKQLAEEKLYEHWRQNNPDLRKIESEQMKDHVVGAWSGQVEEYQEKMRIEEEERIEFERQMEEERVRAMKLERQKEEEKLLKEKEMRGILKEQMDELKKRETEAELLKQEEDALQQEQWRLEELEEERRKMETAREQKEMGRMLLRQHKAQMMRRSRQILEELEQDKLFLESLIAKEQEEREIQTARKEKARADAAWMKQVIEDQIQVEKAREAELDMLYQDEAARMWQKRDAEWEREKKARERLMREVLDDRQDQIEAKLEEVRMQREESIQQREQLIREMEIANQLTRREQEEAEEQKEAMKLDLKAQITSRKEREYDARKRLEEEIQVQREEDEDYEQFLKQETERMKLRGFTPRQHGRKTAWM